MKLKCFYFAVGLITGRGEVCRLSLPCSRMNLIESIQRNKSIWIDSANKFYQLQLPTALFAV